MKSFLGLTFAKAALFGGMLCGTAVAADYAPLVCDKADSAAQKAVCAHYPLGQQEARMATLFEWVTQFVAMGQRDDLLDGQRAFLERREACGAAVACLTSAYAERVAVLQRAMTGVARRGPF